MALIKSISGIRGTIGGKSGSNLTPIDIVECTAGYATWLINSGGKPKVITGRDGRISGDLVSSLAIQTLIGMGIDVVDLGLSTTPTVEMMVSHLEAGGGIIFTASHNPKEWNALKFLNSAGEFISAQDGQDIIDIIESKDIVFAGVDHLGTLTYDDSGISFHIGEVLKNRYVDIDKVRTAQFKVVVDCINSTGEISIPPLLDTMGVEYILINADNFGQFAHNPEPLPHHLTQLSEKVISHKAHLGISVDPDVDRLAFVCEDGTMFGEEYTLVAIGDYIMSQNPGHAVSNLSSTRALSDVATKNNSTYSASAVGEVNVVNEMKRTNAVIGGEGNGGIILPDLHYGRDALAGLAIFLTLMAERGEKVSVLRDSFPQYVIIKDKIELTQELDLNTIFKNLKETFSDQRLNDIDGLKIDFAEGWVHMRKSNTEPIVRIYCEAQTQQKATELINSVKSSL